MCEPCGGARGKIEVIRICPLGIANVCPKISWLSIKRLINVVWSDVMEQSMAKNISTNPAVLQLLAVQLTY